MALKRKISLGLLIFTGLIILLDGGFTLLGQADYYWRNYQLVNEANPMAKYMLVRHPLFFIVNFLIYALLCLLLIYFLRGPLNLMTAMILIFWHTWGSSSWLKIILRKYIDLPWYSYASWYLPLIYYAILGIILGWVIWRRIKIKKDVQK